MESEADGSVGEICYKCKKPFPESNYISFGAADGTGPYCEACWNAGWQFGGYVNPCGVTLAEKIRGAATKLEFEANVPYPDGNPAQKLSRAVQAAVNIPDSCSAINCGLPDDGTDKHYNTALAEVRRVIARELGVTL